MRPDFNPLTTHYLPKLDYARAHADEGSDDHREAFILDGKTIAAVLLDYDLSGPVQRLFENLTPMSATLH